MNYKWSATYHAYSYGMISLGIYADNPAYIYGWVV